MDRESGQHGHLGRGRDAAWLGGRVGGRDAVAEQAVQQVQGGDVFTFCLLSLDVITATRCHWLCSQYCSSR